MTPEAPDEEAGTTEQQGQQEKSNDYTHGYVAFQRDHRGRQLDRSNKNGIFPDTWLAGGGKPVETGAADEHAAGARGQSSEHVGAPPDARFERNLDAVTMASTMAGSASMAAGTWSS